VRQDIRKWRDMRLSELEVVLSPNVDRRD
jgi:hypothetical protein